jgi:hypothetical protein
MAVTETAVDLLAVCLRFGKLEALQRGYEEWPLESAHGNRCA